MAIPKLLGQLLVQLLRHLWVGLGDLADPFQELRHGCLGGRLLLRRLLPRLGSALYASGRRLSLGDRFGRLLSLAWDFRSFGRHWTG
jgi:hypothetical protein